MFVGRAKEFGSIMQLLKAKRTNPEKPLILGVSGLFGSGKTTLVNQVISEFIKEGNADGIYITNEDIGSGSLPEYAYSLANSYKPLGNSKPRFSVEETDSRRRRYMQIVGKLGTDVIPILRELRNSPRTVSDELPELENEKFALEIAIKNQFNSTDDQRLILDTGRILSESFVIDMMTTHFPLLQGMKSLQDYIVKGEAPKKIVFFIDTYEKISAMVNPWFLESLLPFFYTKRFGDLQSYRTPYLPDDSFIHDFFDIRLLISGREKLTMTDLERRWDRYREGITEFRIEPFTKEELKKYITLNGLEGFAKDTDKVMKLTQGLPYLVALWADSAKQNKAGDEKMMMNSLAEQRIFWYKTPKQCDWIRAAAFLDWFDADALQCFPCIADEAEAAEAFDYLRYSSEVVQPGTKKEGKFEVYEIIRNSLRESTWQESSEMAVEYQEAAQSFYDAFAVLEKFSPHDRHLIRRLAYFDNFDDEAIARCFGGEAHIVRELIAKSPEMINCKNNIFSMKDDVAIRLRRYNRSADSKFYHKILDEVRELWFWRRATLEKEITGRETKIQEINIQLAKTQADFERTIIVQDEAFKMLGVLQSEARNIKTDKSGKMTAKETMIFRTSSFFLAFFVLLLLTVKSLPIDERTIDVLRSAAFILAPFFLFVSAGLLAKMLYSKNNSQQKKAMREDIVSTEQRLLNKQYEYHDLGAQIKKIEFEISALKANAERLKSEIAVQEYKLINSYV